MLITYLSGKAQLSCPLDLQIRNAYVSLKNIPLLLFCPSRFPMAESPVSDDCERQRSFLPGDFSGAWKEVLQR